MKKLSFLILTAIFISSFAVVVQSQATESKIVIKAKEYIVQKKYKEAFEILENTTEAAALTLLGECSHFGHGVAVDFEKAKNYYLKALKKGSAEAANHLGRLYVNGEGVTKDPKKAEEFYEKACELGDQLGCHNREAISKTYSE
ncbi:MAG TPA: tetratricopeptide repeat protein [Alphaproteobacteria bacterium]|nr:tetratricopeptide repeat protein [Alphaproteobacteria bacterium]HQS94605.1 tetratricopeptide repeat protein [Alphaproteobacteria bacterium]